MDLTREEINNACRENIIVETQAMLDDSRSCEKNLRIIFSAFLLENGIIFDHKVLLSES
jgi:hypothetical protein